MTSRKEIVALGQIRRQEISDATAIAELTDDQRRLLLCQRINVQNTDLASAAITADLISGQDFVVFHNHGY